VNTFVYAIALEENDTERHQKLIELKLTSNEWERVELFLGLLAVRNIYFFITYLTYERCVIQHADKAQQAFSSDQVSTLHLGIPALEALHKAWSSRADKPKYVPFTPALTKACDKVDEYYEKTTDSPAYILAMCMLSHAYYSSVY
jgi:hypothetical protein